MHFIGVTWVMFVSGIFIFFLTLVEHSSCEIWTVVVKQMVFKYLNCTE